MAGRFSVEAVFKAVDRITAPVSRMENRVGKFTRGMERSLRRVNKVVGKVTGGMLRMASGAAKLGGLAIAAGIAATALAINKVATAADELAKRTRRIQFPIKEFQEWQFVAQQSGLSTAEFDKSMEKFTKTVGEARAGTGTLFTILNKTNKPLLKQLTNAENSAEAFEIYLDAIRKTENQLDKTALATSAFGRTGAKFLNITEQTTAAVEALRKEQRENGVISAQSATAAEEYNDAVNSLKRSLGGLLRGVILPLLPALTETVKGWRNWIAANREMIASKVVAFVENMRGKIGLLIEKIRGFNESRSIFGDIVTIVGVLSSVIGGLAKVTFAIGDAIGFMAAKLVGVFDAIVNSTAFKLILRVLSGAGDLISGNFELPSFLKPTFDAGFDPDAQPEAAPSVVSPQERTARSIEEQRTTSTTEVVLTAEQGTAARVSNRSKMGRGLTLSQSGAF